MSDRRTYGEILRSEREYAGYDLTTMSNRLHIRPDILAAIENCDFDRMPARGYTKNMIRAYARALHLDERMISDLYLEEVNAHELGFLRPSESSRSRNFQQSRSLSRSRELPPGRSRDLSSSRSYDLSSTSSRDFSRSSSFGFSESRDLGDRRSGRYDDYDREDDYRSSRRGRRSYDSMPLRERPQRGKGDYDSPGRRGNASRPLDARTDGAQQRDRRGRGAKKQSAVSSALGSVVASFGGSRSRQDGRIQRPLSTVGANPPYAASQVNSRQPGNQNLTILLAVVAIAIVAIIVIVLFVNGSSKATEEVPNIPISGLTDTSSPEDENQVSGVQVAPKEVLVSYSVASGQSAWMEVYENGAEEATLAEVVDGPSDRTFNVTDRLTIRTANPDAVTVSVDGEKVQLTKDSDSSYYSYSVDFADVLRQWQADHASSSNTTATPPNSDGQQGSQSQQSSQASSASQNS